MAEREAAGLRLCGQDSLPAQQQFIGDIARQPVQDRGGKSQPRRPVQDAAEGLRDEFILLLL